MELRSWRPQMNKKLFNNTIFNIIVPMSVSGITTLGYFFLITSVSSFTTFNIFLSGCYGFVVGILIKNNYEWKK